jgi:BirA family biotin operon repressor/biotin-[acetyl-CoA-carboxylase] ligase
MEKLPLSLVPYTRILSSTTSTNDEARDLGNQGAPDGSCVIAETQTAGRGRQSRRWFSPPERNIYFSQIIRILPGNPGLISLIGAAATRNTIAQWLLQNPEPTIKWPNDILVEGRKIAGLLAELIQSPTGSFAVLGIGINVNMFPEEFPQGLRRPATSLKEILGKDIDLNQVTHKLASQLSQWRNTATNNPERLIAYMNQHCSTLGSVVSVNSPDKNPRVGKALKINDDGTLRVLDSKGQYLAIQAGDVDPIETDGSEKLTASREISN